MREIRMESDLDGAFTEFYLAPKGTGIEQSLVRVCLINARNIGWILKITKWPFSDEIELSNGTDTILRLTGIDQRIGPAKTPVKIKLNGTFLFLIDWVSPYSGNLKCSISSALDLIGPEDKE